MRAHRLLRWLLALALVAAAWNVRAEPIARVVIVRPASSDALLNEALIRTRGELGAVGLTVEVQLAGERQVTPQDESIYGRLVFRRSETRLEIEAFAPGVEVPIVQVLDTTRPGIDAVVVSVRAVEALRAAMLEYAQSARAAEQSVPDSVLGFTKLDRPKPAAEPAKPPQPPAKPPAEPPRRDDQDEDAPPPPEPVDAEDGLRWNVWLGSELSLDVQPSVPTLSARLGAFLGVRGFAVGLGLEHGWSVTRLEANEGSAGVTRGGGLVLLKGELRPWPAVSPFVQIGAGVRRYQIGGRAGPGYDATDASHWSGLATLDVGSTYRLFRNVGAYSSVGARFSTDAPALEFADRKVAVLERPALAVAAGLIVGAL